MACRLYGAKPLPEPNAGLLSIGPLATIFSEILIKVQNFHSWKCIWKISSAKWWSFCPGGSWENSWVMIKYEISSEIVVQNHWWKISLNNSGVILFAAEHPTPCVILTNLGFREQHIVIMFASVSHKAIYHFPWLSNVVKPNEHSVKFMLGIKLPSPYFLLIESLCYYGNFNHQNLLGRLWASNSSPAPNKCHPRGKWKWVSKRCQCTTKLYICIYCLCTIPLRLSKESLESKKRNVCDHQISGEKSLRVQFVDHVWIQH